jgi:hypothetical protein
MTFRFFWLKASIIAMTSLLLAGSAWASGAYGPRITVGNVYQQTSSLTSLDGAHAANCSNTDTCYVLFQQAPGQKKLIVEHVACDATVNPTVSVVRALLMSKTVVHSAALLPVQMMTSTITEISQSVLFPLVANERAVVYLGYSGVASVVSPSCTVSGHLLP